MFVLYFRSPVSCALGMRRALLTQSGNMIRRKNDRLKSKLTASHWRYTYKREFLDPCLLKSSTNIATCRVSSGKEECERSGDCIFAESDSGKHL